MITFIPFPLTFMELSYVKSQGFPDWLSQAMSSIVNRLLSLAPLTRDWVAHWPRR